MGFTTSYANSILESLVKNAYLALSTTTPTAAGGNVTEPATSAGYARVAASSGSITASDRAITNSAYIYYPEASESWGTITHVCVYDNAARGAGTLRYFGALNSSVDVAANTVPLFKPNTINISLDK
jgi:hypothetical protein